MESAEDHELVFSNGSYLANLAASSDILTDSWTAISVPQGDKPVIKDHPDYNIIGFVSSPDTTGDSVLSTVPPDFQFLCSDTHPSFQINEAACSQYNRLHNEFRQLQEKVKTSFEPEASDASAERMRKEDPKPYIITGRRLNGSVASLFTLSLLNTLDSTKYKLILCITFCSPLLGDNDFQQALLCQPAWNSCFLHVVHHDDRIPRSFLDSHKPFGTYLWSSASGFACFQAPDSIVKLLTYESPNAARNRESQTFNYEKVVECLGRMPLLSNGSGFVGYEADSYKAGITAQVTAVGLSQRQQQDEGFFALIENIVKHEQEVIKRQREEVDPAKKLEEMRVYLAYMEWYMGRCRADGQGPGYYDSFKNAQEQRDNGADKYKAYLMGYWEKVVEDAKKKPQIPGAPLRDRWLYGGLNYRRIIEPLEIAEYYSSGQKEYIKQGRSKHYKLLEEWMEDYWRRRPPRQAGPSKSSVTEDSCFWAHVEEAIRSCRALVRGGSPSSSERENLSRFEKYVMGLIKKYEVSSDIFLEQSSYMEWWRQYDKILGDSPGCSSTLAAFMRNERYKNYTEGSLRMDEEGHLELNPPDSSNAGPSSTEGPGISPSSFSLSFLFLVLSLFLYLFPFPFSR